MHGTVVKNTEILSVEDFLFGKCIYDQINSRLWGWYYYRIYLPFFSNCLYKIRCCVCTDAFQILWNHLNQKHSGKRVRFWGWLVCLLQWRVSFTYSVILVDTDISLICFLYITGPRQSKTQMKCCIFPFTGN